jgi:hypothetical protein
VDKAKELSIEGLEEKQKAIGHVRGSSTKAAKAATGGRWAAGRQPLAGR